MALTRNLHSAPLKCEAGQCSKRGCASTVGRIHPRDIAPDLKTVVTAQGSGHECARMRLESASKSANSRTWDWGRRANPGPSMRPASRHSRQFDAVAEYSEGVFVFDQRRQRPAAPPSGFRYAPHGRGPLEAPWPSAAGRPELGRYSIRTGPCVLSPYAMAVRPWPPLTVTGQALPAAWRFGARKRR